MSEDTRIEIGDVVCLVDLCCQKMRNRYCGWIGTALEIYEDHSAIMECRDGMLLFNHVRFVGIALFAVPVPECWLQKLRPKKQSTDRTVGIQRPVDEVVFQEMIDEPVKQGFKMEVL